MSKTLSEVNLIELLPPSISRDEGSQAASTALDIQLQDINANIKLVRLLSRILELPSDVLDLLAWQFHIDTWSPDYTLDRKREKISASLITHAYKGTVWAVKEAVRLEGYSTVTVDKTVGNWWEFSLEVDAEEGVSLPEIVLEAIEKAKNLRSKLLEFKINFEAQAPLTAYAAVGVYIEL